MEQKILQFENGYDRYFRLAKERAESGDLMGALSFFTSAMNINKNYEVLAEIACVYAEMGALELSNNFWFEYIDKAPKDKVSVAYEELAINYFYLDDFLSSSFYFHQKLSIDGYITKEGLDTEILDFFSGEEFKNNSYFIAYPFDRADFSYPAKRAKRALAVGNFEEAIKIFSTIPRECLDEETAGDYTIALFMGDKLEEAEKLARESIERHGENITAYAHLSTIYDMREDSEKSQYYYQKALECVKGEKNEEYKLATCAIERADHKTVKKCLEKIVEDRAYDTTMRFFYGLSLLNLGEYEKAEKEFSFTYRLSPADGVYRYYALLSQSLASGQNCKINLPLKYLKVLPSNVEDEYKKIILDLINNPSKISFALKKKEVKDAVEWGIRLPDKDIPRQSVFILATAFSRYAKSFMLSTLMDNMVDTAVKRVIVYALAVNGYKDKFGVVDRDFYFKIKPKKLKCEKNSDGGLYLSAYGLCLSRMAFYGIDDLSKIGDAIDKIYLRLKDKVGYEDVTNEELSALILYVCKYKRYSTDSEIMKVFEITLDKFTALKKLYKGDNNG